MTVFLFPGLHRIIPENLYLKLCKFACISDYSPGLAYHQSRFDSLSNCRHFLSSDVVSEFGETRERSEHPNMGRPFRSDISTEIWGFYSDVCRLHEYLV